MKRVNEEGERYRFEMRRVSMPAANGIPKYWIHESMSVRLDIAQVDADRVCTKQRTMQTLMAVWL